MQFAVRSDPADNSFAENFLLSKETSLSCLTTGRCKVHLEESMKKSNLDSSNNNLAVPDRTMFHRINRWV